ncbi:MAG: hypothetical protein FJ395_14920 [Verrucomicrobia bacterium]|nr:hypothetical protein [Verrucomicrobiota bacterium]
MADPNIVPDEESKKDTVRINLPAGTQPAKRDTAAMSADQTKKETAMMGMPGDPKKDTSRVAVPSAKPAMPDMPRPTVRLRREPIPTAPAPTATTTPAARAQVPEMPRPTVKLKVEESGAVSVEPAPAMPSVTPTAGPVRYETPSSAVDVVLSLLATAAAAGVLAYLAFAVYK